MPPKQRLGTYRLSFLVNKNLIVHRQLVLPNGQSKVGFHGQAFGHLFLHHGIVETDAVATVFLGTKHGHVGLTKELFEGIIVIKKQGDTNTWRTGVLKAIQFIGFVQCFPDFLTDLFHTGRSAGSIGRKPLQNENKLIATKPCDGIPLPDCLLEPFADLNQQLISCHMARRVIDVLEVIQIDKDQGAVAMIPGAPS